MRTGRSLTLGVCFTLAALGYTPRCRAQYLFETRGAATYISEDCFQLTQADSLNSVGAAWYNSPLHLYNAFDLNFLVNFGCDPKGGEGMAFVLHTSPDSTQAVGCKGAALGFSNAGNCKALKPSLAVELDTKNNGVVCADADFDHFALVRDGIQSKPLLPIIKASTKQTNIKDCHFHRLRAQWKPSTREFRVWFDDDLRLLLVKDIQGDYFSGSDKVWFGFTGSTGATKSNTQVVCVKSVALEVDHEYLAAHKFENSIDIESNILLEEVTVDVNFEKTEDLTIKIFDANGKLRKSQRDPNAKKGNYSLRLGGLPTGMYIVQVINASGRQVNKRIVHIGTLRA